MDKSFGFKQNGEQVFSVDTTASGVFIEDTDEGHGVAIPWALIEPLAETLSNLARLQSSMDDHLTLGGMNSAELGNALARAAHKDNPQDSEMGDSDAR